MFSLLLLLFPLLTSSLADSSCMTLQETKALLKEQEVKMQMDVEARLAALEASRLADGPQVVMCAYQDLWMQEDSPISFDEFLTNFHNAEGDGALDLTTGIFTA